MNGSKLKVKVLVSSLDSVTLEKKVNKFLQENPDIELVKVQQTFGLDKVLLTIFYRG